MASETNKNGGGETTEHPRTCLKNRLWDKWLDFIIALIVWGTVEFLLLTIVPAVAKVYAQFGGKLPPLTRLIVQFAEYVGSTTSLMMVVGLILFQSTRTHVLPEPSSANSVRSWDDRVMLIIILIGTVLFFVVAFGLWMP